MDIWIISFVFIVLVFIIVIIYCIIQNYRYDREIEYLLSDKELSEIWNKIEKKVNSN